MAFFVIDENHNLHEAYDKEGVLAVLEQAIADGSLAGLTADSSFVKQFKCCVTGDTHYIAFVTQAKYNELEASGEILDNCLYFLTDDTTAEGVEQALKDLAEAINSTNERATALEDETAEIKTELADQKARTQISHTISTTATTGETSVEVGNQILYLASGTIEILASATSKEIADLTIQDINNYGNKASYDPTTGIISYTVYGTTASTSVKVLISYKTTVTQDYEETKDYAVYLKPKSLTPTDNSVVLTETGIYVGLLSDGQNITDMIVVPDLDSDCESLSGKDTSLVYTFSDHKLTANTGSLVKVYKISEV